MKKYVDSRKDVSTSIKNVAIYLRKSQGDEDKDLEKHDLVLKEICEESGWNFVIYKEVVSGDTIKDRPEFKKLLRDVEDEIFDGILVYDYDRLGRGKGSDQERIINTLKYSDTLLIQANPFQIYDPLDERDEETMEFKGFIARREYNMIVKRMTSGRKVGARMGRWTLGQAPFGYEYNEETKTLMPEKFESEIYKKRIVERYLDGDCSISDIVWELNKEEIKTRRGKLWTERAINYLLKSEVHLGNVVFNKSEEYYDKERRELRRRSKPREEWLVVENAHPALKTIEQHERILMKMRSRMKERPNSINAMTSLVKCFSCGETLYIKKSKDGKDQISNCTNCNENKGGPSELIEYTILEAIKSLRERLSDKEVESDIDNEREEIVGKIESLEDKLAKYEEAMERIEEAFEMGMYDAQKAKKKMQERNKQILETEEEIIKLRKRMESTVQLDKNERIKLIDNFLENIKKAEGGREKNKIYKSIIGEIIWAKPDLDDLEITVNFI